MSRLNQYLVFAVLLLVSNSRLSAQFSPGQIFGINFSSTRMNIDGVKFDHAALPGINFGTYTELKVTRDLSIQPAILFTSKGAVYKTDTTETTFSPVYLEAPVMVMYKSNSGFFRIILGAGSYMAVGVSGYVLEQGKENRDMRFGNAMECDLKPFDFGARLCAGITLGNLTILATFERSYINLAPGDRPLSDIRNNVVGLTFIATTNRDR
ncbi:MAG: outer membrane beta-barrel protein [Bacteroidales bacterium]